MMKYKGVLKFEDIHRAFKGAGIHVHPLNMPVDTIENKLRELNWLTKFEHLGPFNSTTESFPFYEDLEVKVPIKLQIKTKAINWLIDKLRK